MEGDILLHRFEVVEAIWEFEILGFRKIAPPANSQQRSLTSPERSIQMSMLSEEKERLLASFNSDEDDSTDDTNYGDTLDGSADKRTANQRAEFIWIHSKKRVCKMNYETMSDLRYSIWEILLAVDVPYRDEFLDKRAEHYPLIQRYKGLDHLTICGLSIALGCFVDRKRLEMRKTGNPKELEQITQVSADHTAQITKRERLVDELSRRPPEVVEVQETGGLWLRFTWMINHWKTR